MAVVGSGCRLLLVSWFPDRRAGERLDLGVGATLMLPAASPPHGLRVAAEVAAPLYQRLSGPHFKTDLELTVSSRYALCV